VPAQIREAEGEAVEDDGAPTAARPRRRRRGGRGRGRSGAAVPAEPAATEPTADGSAEEAEPAATEPDEAPPRRRRRRGGRGRKKATAETPAADAETEAPAEPAKTRRRRSTPKAETETETGSGTADAPVSTRLRRRTLGRGTVRRRREEMPLVPRVTDKLMVVTEHGERDQIAVLEGRDLVQHFVTRVGATSMVGNVYLGRVQNVLPGMEAAFVDVGRGRNAVLYAGEVNWSPEDLEGAPPRIEHVLRSGQSILVQVTKDPIGGKGARLTAQISLPGRYLVLAPNSNVSGISRRLPDAERRRLKAIMRKIRPERHGVIVRTAAEGASEEAIAADLQRLVAEWEAIEQRSKKAKAPSVIYEEPELTVRVVRDVFTDEEFRELVTDSPRVYRIVTDYLRGVAPDLLAKVRLHEGPLPVFEEFHIVEQIHKGLDRKVWLPSGGYLVIDRTEALTVIDVNTGKSVGKTNLEETVVNTNLEAAREVARQLRLRDIGGMIVIDFIDMLLEQNKKKVIEAMKEALAQDKSRSQVFDISPLGLLEVTRKRVSGGLLESFSEPCPTCEGRGLLLTYDVN
jgi:ribonuclease E